MSYFQKIESRRSAIAFRNAKWLANDVHPGWVDPDTVGLDQFFTTEAVARECYSEMEAYLRAMRVDASKCHYLEPSAGSGAFFDLLPKQRRTGIDVMPMCREIIKNDFLTWNPDSLPDKPIVVVGNPPFGYRAWLALSFVNHAATFADHIGMILPMAFQSDGKGSPKHRVLGMELKASRTLSGDSFIDEDGRPAKVNALWQIWSKGENTSKRKVSCEQWVDLFTVDQRKERLCGHKRMEEADFFLQRTFYKEPPKPVKCFSQVRYVCGYGIVLKQKKREITEFLHSIDWRDYSNLAAHNCRHISMYHIERALVDGGYANA